MGEIWFYKTELMAVLFVEIEKVKYISRKVKIEKEKSSLFGVCAIYALLVLNMNKFVHTIIITYERCFPKTSSSSSYNSSNSMQAASLAEIGLKYFMMHF